MKKEFIVRIGHHVRNFVFSSAILATTLQCGTLSVLAKDAEPPNTGDMDLSFITKDPTKDVFKTLTSTTKDAGSSLYQLISVISVIGLLASLIAVGISLAMNKNSNKREENKSHLLWILLGCVIVFGAGAILGFMQSIGKSL